MKILHKKRRVGPVLSVNPMPHPTLVTFQNDSEITTQNNLFT